jgi:hypothetical protein
MQPIIGIRGSQERLGIAVALRKIVEHGLFQMNNAGGGAR